MKKINWKTIALVAASSLLTASLAIGGTLAYLTDRDSKVNVFTVGDVEIELNEEFEQGATLLPGASIQKEPTITNTGNNDAWVWATVAFPAALDNDDASKNVVHFNYYNDHVNSTEWTWKDQNGKWNVETKTINGVDYNVYTVLYQTALEPDEVTSPVIHTVYMDTNVDIDPDGNWNVVENGVATPVDWNSKEDGNPMIYVSAYAVQAEGFKTVWEAYDAYAEQWGTNGVENAEVPALVSTAADLSEALANGQDVILNADIELDAYLNIATAEEVTISLNGHNITREGGTAIYVNNKDAVVNIEGKGEISGLEAVFVNAGTVNIHGGTYTNQGNVTVYVYTEDGTVNIYGGKFSSPDNQFVLNLKDGSNGNINVYGGTYVNYDPAASTTENPVADFVADGYDSVDNGDGTYTVTAAE